MTEQADPPVPGRHEVWPGCRPLLHQTWTQHQSSRLGHARRRATEEGEQLDLWPWNAPKFFGPYDVACPRCKAGVGRWCSKGRSGNKSRRGHKSRANLVQRLNWRRTDAVKEAANAFQLLNRKKT